MSEMSKMSKQTCLFSAFIHSITIINSFGAIRTLIELKEFNNIVQNEAIAISHSSIVLPSFFPIT